MGGPWEMAAGGAGDGRAPDGRGGAGIGEGGHCGAPNDGALRGERTAEAAGSGSIPGTGCTTPHCGQRTC
jgi:hypothetical protein